MGIIAITSDFYLVTAYILAGLIGVCVGSFLNVVIYRIPSNISLSNPPSHCPKCHYRLKWYDNIPVLSYTMLGGKCRCCHVHIPFRYTAVEISNMLLWLLCIFMFKGNLIYAGIAAIVCAVCICIFYIDLEHMLIFDSFQIILAILGIAAIFFDKDYAWYSHLIGAAVGGLFFLGIAVIMGKILNREALGGGDIKLAAVSGLFLGWQKFMLMMLIASVSASIVMLIRYKKTKVSREIPFGPFMSVGFLLSMFFGTQLIQWYVSLLMP